MVYWTILFYQVYRNHAKSNGIKPLFFFEAKGLLSQPPFCEKMTNSEKSLKKILTKKSLIGILVRYSIAGMAELADAQD